MRRFNIFIALVALVLLPAAAPARPQPPPPAPVSHIPRFAPILTSYDVYVGGLRFLSADILFRAQGDAYDAHLSGRLTGLLAHFLTWDAELQVQGRIKGDAFQPIGYSQSDQWGKKLKVTRLAFTPAGDIAASFTPPADDPNPGHVTDDEKRGSLDPITGLLQMLATVAVNRNCAMTVPIFDGKRRFDITGKDTGAESIDAEDYGVFKGVARTCDADFKMISGEWKDKDKAKFWYKSADETGREPFHIWLGQVAPDLPALPVRLESGSVWGLLIVHLAKWRYATDADLK